jgi:hypothetical protein
MKYYRIKDYKNFEKNCKLEVRKVIDIWENKGGVILGPTHKALQKTPIENILAIYEQFGGNKFEA